MSLQHILLGLLREPQSGYDLKRAFDTRIRHYWFAELSQIYPALKRLEDRGCLRSRREPGTRGPHRKVYERTAAGLRELEIWLAQGPLGRTLRVPYLAQLAFLGELQDPRATRRFLEELRTRIAARRDQLVAIEAQWAEEDPDFPDRLDDEGFHAHLTLRKGIRTLSADVEWAEECLARVKKRKARKRAGRRS